MRGSLVLVSVLFCSYPFTALFAAEPIVQRAIQEVESQDKLTSSLLPPCGECTAGVEHKKNLCLSALNSKSWNDSAEALRPCFDYSVQTQSSIGITTASGSPSLVDRNIVSHYIDVWAYLVNKALREGDSSYLDKVQNREKLSKLDNALGRFPVYRGIVFRGSLFPPTKTLTIGEKFRDPAFVSTSQDPEVAEGYAGVAGYVSVILTKSGRLLSYDRSTETLSGEKEVLLPRNSSFKIFKVESDKKRNLTFVFLIEQ